MDVAHENINNTGSLVSLTNKPPAKGRKKKSAVAKLAERKRRGSECGSEPGSLASLQREESSYKGKTDGQLQQNEKVDSLLKEAVINKPDNKRECNNQIDELDKVRDLNEKNRNNSSLTKADKEDSVQNRGEKQSPPKPVPRKVNRKKNLDKDLIEGFEGGTVVSIYEKREQTPPRKQKQDKAAAVDKNIEQKSEPEKSDLKRELFPRSGGLDHLDGPFSFLGPGKPRAGISPLGDLPPLDAKPVQKSKDVEDCRPVPMDIDVDLDKEDDNKDKSKDDLLISNNAPSDATVHRFRAMRMTPDRSRSEESLKNAHFAPKPPPTPRSARKTPPKGEKRNRDSNSSGEEADVETKKQNSDSVKISDSILNTSLSNLKSVDTVKMDVDMDVVNKKEPVKKGLSIHPNVKEVKDLQAFEVANKNMDLNSPEKAYVAETPEDVESDKVDTNDAGLHGIDNLSDNGKTSKKSGKKKIIRKSRVTPQKDRKTLSPLDGSDLQSPGKNSIDTIGSASDLKAISEQYQEVLKGETSHEMSGPIESVIPEPKNNGKLSPIQPKTLPPPLPQDMKSTSMRTTYKTDPKYTMSKFFGRSFSGQSEKERAKFETMSHRSLSATATVNVVPTREARDRMKHGTLGSMLLSSSELDKYFPDRKVGLWAGCWNMAEIKDCREPLDDFLLPEVSEFVQDIYAIGTQENAMNKKEWEILLQETIGPSHVLFHSAAHGALHLAVFVKRDLIWFCTVPEDDLVQTRAVTMVKTKGAIAVSFQFFGTSFIFINCHFAPGDGKKKERLDDYMKIIRNLNLPKQGNTGSPNGSSSDVTTRYDSVFWMGDLNFRIESYKGKQAVEDIVKYIEQQEHTNFEDLLSGDQLSKLIVEGSIFQGFQEGRINFRPTYKYDIGHDTFDTSSKNRIPSYTDRVLFRAKKKNSIVCTHYDSPSNFRLSDHHPVYAIFEVAVQPARDCTLPLAAGQFDRTVYAEANKRRTMKVEVIDAFQREKSSKVCSIQ